MTVPQEVKLARHGGDLDDDGHDTYGGTLTGFVKTTEGGQDTIFAHGSMGSTETFDPTDGNVHTATLDAACTFTLNAPVGSGAATLELYLTQDGTGSRLVTWPGSVVWPGGTTPTLTTTAGATDRFILETLDGGTTWYGVMVGGSTGSALTVKDEGSSLDTAVTSLDFVGGGVVATNTGHAVTVTVSSASVVANAHAHVVSENHLSNGSATTYTLDQAFEDGSVIAWNTTTLARLGVTETQPDQATVSAAGSSGDTIMFDYAATVV